MAAKNRKKQQKKKNPKSKKQIQRFEKKVEEEEELVVLDNENNDNNDNERNKRTNREFDLEAMEKMLEEGDNEDDDEIVDDGNNQLEKEFLDPDDEDDDDDEDDEEEEDNVDEESRTADESEGDDESVGEESDESIMQENETTTTDNDQIIIKEQGDDENCTVDLRNLLAMNSHQVNSRLLYSKPKKDTTTTTTICMDGMLKANEDYLLQKASEGCSQLLSGLWNLETEKSDAGPMAILPTYCEVVTPRELPPPAPKADTKWEKFAKERGIAPKEKRSRKVWDEATQSWAYRTGYQKATSMDDPESWPIMEVKKNDDPFENPWQRARDAKKERVEKNTLNRMKNAEVGGALERGTARRVLKAKKEAREKGRSGGNMDLKNFTTSQQQQPSGIPMDLVDGKQRGKSLTKLALMATQTSTASMGKFDKMREGEPERRKSMSGLKKRKYESATSESVVKAESKKSLKVLENVIAGGGKAKERAIRRGQYAKGETGHDYDYDDGLGPSTYRKKKGRAGIGKMKKITKKMAK